MHRIAQAESALIAAGVQVANVSQYLRNPEGFIAFLYDEHSSSSSGDALHELTETIARYFALDIENIRRQLIGKWLLAEDAKAPPAKEVLSLRGALDDALDESRRELLGSSDDEVVLRKAIYVLRRMEKATAVSFLLNVVYSESSKMKALTRYRAARALYTISSAAYAAEVFGRSVSQLHEDVLAVIYVLLLEEIKVQQSMKEFHAANKEGLVRCLFPLFLIEIHQVRTILRSAHGKTVN
jgi:hypothetical protein